MVWLPDGTPIGPFDQIFRQIKNTGDYDVEVRFNSLGFRDDKPFSLAGKDGLFVVGDSSAFGWGVDVRHRFSDRLQAILQRRVFNIAIPSADLEGYQGLVRHAEANAAVIRKLILCVTMENDLRIYDVPTRPPCRRKRCLFILSWPRIYFF